VLLATTALLAAFTAPQRDLQREYWVYVAAESSDEVFLVRFDGKEAKVEERIPVGYMPTEIEGPHGLTVSPDGEYWFVSMAHGMPYGILYKYATGTNELLGQTELGLFPATMAISSATGLLYCVNFDLHGDMTPSSISVVDTESMDEVAQTVTGAMPHGSRISPDGQRHYSCAMMSDELFEMDTRTFEVLRVLKLNDGKVATGDEDGHGHGGEGELRLSQAAKPVKPTWVDPHPTRPVVFVALNGAAQVVEVDLESWAITRRFPTAAGPYNLVVSNDGKRMVVSYKTAGSVGIWDLERNEELARIPATRKVTHGVTISPDSRYAFVSNESIGGDAGTLDVFDLTTNKLVASVELGLQPGGITFWKIEERN